MKKYLITLLVLASVLFDANAQKYEPRESWPYLYENFQTGAVRTLGGSLVEDSTFNISIADGSLHYIVDGKIMKIDMMSIYTARLGDQVFVNVGGKMYQVLAETDNGSLLQFYSIDFDKLDKVDIGYGISSSSASAMNVTSLLQGMDSMVNTHFDTAMEKRDNGIVLPQLIEKFIYVDGKLVPASKYGVREFPGIDKDAANAFFKEKKIRWNKDESLAELIDFVYGQIAN